MTNFTIFPLPANTLLRNTNTCQYEYDYASLTGIK